MFGSPRSSSGRARPSWADHVPHRQVRIPAPPLMARRSAVAVLTASALLGGGVYAATAAGSPATVLGLTGTGDCDDHVAARQLDAASETRAQARALLTDLTVSDDPDAAALASRIRELGYVPASQPDRWRQAAVDTSDQLHRLDGTDPHLQEVGVRLAAAGLGPTPADLLPAPGPTPGVGAERVVQTAPPLPAACTDTNSDTNTDSDDPAPGAPPSATSQSTSPHPPATEEAQVTSTPLAESPAVSATPTAPAAETAAAAEPDDDPGTPDGKAAPAADAASTAAAEGSSGSGTRAPAPAPVTTSRVQPSPAAATAAQRGDTLIDSARGAAATETTTETTARKTSDQDAARAAVGMVSDLLQTITEAGDGEATQVGRSVLDALDRDHLESLGADPADLDALDRLRTTTRSSSGGDNGSGEHTAVPGSRPRTTTPEDTDTGESITRTRAHPRGESAGRDERPASTSRSGDSGSVSSSVSSSIEKLTAQARAAAEVDPAAAALVDALDDTALDDADLDDAELDDADDQGEGRSEDSEAADSGGRAGGRPGTVDLGDGDRESGDRSDEQHRQDTTSAGDVSDTDSAAAHGRATADDPDAPESAPPGRGDDDAGARASDAKPADGSTWDRLAQCESSGDWATNSGNGYHGGLQFSPSTWKAFGGQGAAHEASRDEQIAVAERVQAAQGWQAWPACSKRLGLR